MTFMWFGQGKSFRLRSFAMTGAFLVFPLVCTFSKICICVSELNPPNQMLVGTVAFNTLAIVEPTDSSALAIWALGYLFQGLGMAIAFIVGADSSLPYSSRLIILQFITVHFYRAIRYGFHRYVPPSLVTIVIHLRM